MENFGNLREPKQRVFCGGTGPLFYHRKTRKIPGGRWLREAESGRFPPENGLLWPGARGFGGSGSGVNNWAKT
jgi:hypothetical protein